MKSLNLNELRDNINDAHKKLGLKLEVEDLEKNKKEL